MEYPKLPLFSAEPPPSDLKMRLTGATFLVALAVLLIAVISAGIWYRANLPPPSLSQQIAEQTAEKERIHERYVLLSQLPTDTVEVTCTPVSGYHLLDCKVVRAGLDTLKIVHINVPLSKQLPLVNIEFVPGTRDNHILRYSKPLTRAERLAIVDAIRLDID